MRSKTNLELSNLISETEGFKVSVKNKKNDIHKINYKEHPTNKHYKGKEHKRDWIFEEVEGYYPSFFSYWKKCEKYLKNW